MRYLALPRLDTPTRISPPDPQTGRRQHYRYLKEPWYVAPTFWSRWGPEAWAQWATGLLVPGDDGKRWKPEGFLWEDLGPLQRMGKGVQETAELQKRAKVLATSDSPFQRPVQI
jgi:hypothetical protein